MLRIGQFESFASHFVVVRVRFEESEPKWLLTVDRGRHSL